MFSLFATLQLKGVTFTDDRYCPNITFDSPVADYSLKQIRSTGANAIAIVATQYQQNINSTTIFPIYDDPIYQDYYTHNTATLQSLASAIREFKRLGGVVMLKPHIDLIQDKNRSLWRGDIGKNFTTQMWGLWFASYQKFILKYAQLAQNESVQYLSISCQLITASKQEAYWRALITKVRSVYKGFITSSANWSPVNQAQSGEDTQKKWWDAVDYIGIDAYYPVCQGKQNPSLDQLKQAWLPILQRFKNLTSRYNKELIITEIGYCSGDCSRGYKPSRTDMQIQANKYRAALQSILTIPETVIGIFWWSWNTDSGNGGAEDGCITPQYKPAEQVMRQFYGGKTRYPKISQAVCLCTV